MASTKIKAIETEYNGYKFRSRLEARWAVFFDALGITYEHEPIGFEFEDGTKYLPDFYLPDSRQFFEVKGVMSDKDMGKIKKLVSNGKSVAIGYSDGSFECCNNYGCNNFDLDAGTEGSWLCCCSECGKHYFMGNIGSYACLCCDYYDGDKGFDLICWGDDTKNLAWGIAKQARFEWGKTPTKRRVRQMYLHERKINDLKVEISMKQYDIERLEREIHFIEKELEEAKLRRKEYDFIRND